TYYLFFNFEPEFPGAYGYLLFCIPLILILYASLVYSTYWLRAGINRYYKLFKMLFWGGILELLAIWALDSYCSCFFDVTSPEFLYGGFGFFFLLVLILVAGERFFVRYLESFGLRSFYLQVRAVDEAPLNLLVLGGGVACRLYVQNLFCRNYLRHPSKILGIVDDDPALRHLNVYGFQVLGTTSDLDELYAKQPFDMLVVTTALSEAARLRVEEFARRHPVELGVFRVDTHLCMPDDLALAMRGLAEPSADDAVNDDPLPGHSK
ncbi:MAG: hypothetical protein IJJ28_01755, partial [Lentisphaeria bacterium]|nr:hypothetical protein [Lentisphaeria bacterium]